jgi:hypothetical protein
MRAAWERRFGGWTWDSDVSEWRDKYDNQKLLKAASAGEADMGNADTKLISIFRPVRK